MSTLHGQGRMREGQLLVNRSQGGRNETILRVRCSTRSTVARGREYVHRFDGHNTLESVSSQTAGLVWIVPSTIQEDKLKLRT